MQRVIVSILLLLAIPPAAFGWGSKGHDVVCYIAECHLSQRAKAEVSELLEDRSMVYYSSWADGAKYTKEYSYTRPWHYLNMERRESVATAKRSKDGDLLSALEAMEAILRDESADHEAQSFALKIYIHLVGDMHQPMHLGREVDEGGGSIPIIYFTESTSLHSAWDYHLPMGVREWSYMEWQHQMDRLSEAEEATIVAGSYADWMDATHEITNMVYRDTPVETRIFYEYVAKYRPIIEQQLLYGGLRLAWLLNGIYAQ